MTIIITDDEVRRLLPMGECIDAMRVAFRDFAAGTASVARIEPHAPAIRAFRNATWRAKATRPCRLALTVVRGLRPTKALVTST